MSAQRTELDLPKILADLLPGAKRPAELAKKATLLRLTLGLSLKDGSKERLAEFQEDLRTYASVFRQPAESLAFRQLLDRLSSLRGHGLDATQRLLQRTIYPRCYKAFSEKDLPGRLPARQISSLSDLQRDIGQRLNPDSDHVNLSNRADDFFANTVNFERAFCAVDVAKTWSQSKSSLCRRITVKIARGKADLVLNGLYGCEIVRQIRQT